MREGRFAAAGKRSPRVPAGKGEAWLGSEPVSFIIAAGRDDYRRWLGCYAPCVGQNAIR